jgi:branched-subunit amino acid transport protein
MSDYLFSPALTSPLYLWLTILIAGLITYGIRLSFIWLFGKFELPDWLKGALRYVPPAVLTAIIFPELLIQNDQIALTLANDRLLAGLAAIFVAWRTRNAVLTILTGMGVLWLLQWIG